MSIMGVYVIANKVSKKIYIGASNNIEARFLAHRNQLKNGSHYCKKLQEDWNKFGESNFDFKILELSNAQNYVVLERAYIKGFASLDKNCLYNKANVPKSAKPQHTKQPRRTGRASSR